MNANISSFLKNLSLLKTPFNMNFHGYNNVSSWSGLFLSMGFLSIILVFASQSDIFHHATPQVNDDSPALPTRPPVIFKKLRALTINDDTTYEIVNDPSVVEIKVIYHSIFVDQTNTTIMNETVYQLHICSEEDFPENPLLYQKVGLVGHFCLNNEFILEGYYDEPMMKYLEVQVNLCNNATSNNTCKSMDEIKTILYNKDLDFYYFDSVIDASDYKNPIKHTLTEVWSYIDLSTRKERDYIFANLEIQTDDGILFNNINSISDCQFLEEARETLFLQDDIIQPRISIYFFPAKIKRTVKRVYEKISDLLAHLGGTLHFLIFLGLIWTNFHNRFLVQKAVLNEMYTFKMKSKKSKKYDQNREKSAMLKSMRMDTSDVKTERKTNAEIFYTKTEPKELEKPVFETVSEEKEEEIKFLNFFKVPPKKVDTPLPESEKTIEEKTFEKKLEFSEKIVKIKEEKPLDKKIENSLRIDPMKSSLLDSKISSFQNSKNQAEKCFGDQELINRKKNRRKTFLKSFTFHIKKKEENILKFSEFRDHQKDKKINMNILSFLKLKAKCALNRKLTEEEEILRQSERLFQENLEYIEILKKIQEIEKLKHIIFDENQILYV